MKKIKLYGIGNEKNFNYYTLDKKNETVLTLAKIISKTLQKDWELYTEDKNHKQRKINFEKKKEGHEKIQLGKGNARIDIFYGNKKIFLTIHCTLAQRKKFNEALGKISYMPKPKK